SSFTSTIPTHPRSTSFNLSPPLSTFIPSPPTIITNQIIIKVKITSKPTLPNIHPLFNTSTPLSPPTNITHNPTKHNPNPHNKPFALKPSPITFFCHPAPTI
ncbi:hypothetical protein, partial [Staphylococcus capitis]|uniref:hypothetical protein n=1 Tax=Staphylococcus capitis TaxID=29388 RepID=UPI001C92C20C